MSATHPWMKFYPRDWRGDQTLRIVSLAARGLWIECLSIMHEARPYGHLVVNGKPVEADVLARLVGSSEAEVIALRDELLAAGVADLGRNGVLVSRRMVRDENRAKKGRKAVNRRWSQADEKPSEKTEPNRLPMQEPTTQKPEARDQKEETPKPPDGKMPPDVRAVMDAAGFVTPPPDLGLLRQWRSLGADFETEVIPVVKAVAQSVRERTGRAPFKLQLFDQAIRQKVAENAAEIERLRVVERRYASGSPA